MDRSRLALLTLAASSLAPSMSRNTRGRTPFGRRPVRNADEGNAAGNTTETTGSAAADAAAKPPPKTFDQAAVDAIVQKRVRELSGAAAERDALATKVAEYEAKQREAEEAKLSATQRADLERKREREGYEKRIADLDTTAKRERDLRHAALKSGRAASLAGSLATKLYSDKALPHVERLIVDRLVVEAQADGSERLMLRMSDAAADLEPVDTGFAKLLDAEIAPAFFRAQGGSGAQHGTGAGGGNASWKSLPPEERIKAGLGGK